MGYEIGTGGLSAEWIAEATGARVISFCGGASRDGFPDCECGRPRGLCSDSRTLSRGEIFLALRGEKFDGHGYISTALGSGAYAAICDRLPENPSDGIYLLTGSTEKAFLDIAASYKNLFTELELTVGITGSVGKTTTKQMIASVLSEKYETLSTEANYNNLVGLPATLLRLTPGCRAAVLEMGMNARGEISRMSRAARPDIGVITNIGTAHIGLLGSRRAICDAKLEILDGMRDDGLLVLPYDEPLLSGTPGLRISTMCDGADCYISGIREERGGARFDLILDGKAIKELYIPVNGEHNVYDAAIAAAVGVHAGLSEDMLRRGLSSFRNVGSRQKTEVYGGIKVIKDCYNASPESMKASLGILSLMAEQAGGRRIAVLGDMLELGESSSELHRAVGDEVRRCGTDILYTYGVASQEIALGASGGGCAVHSFGADANGSEELIKALRTELKPGDTVLFKASHSIGLEKIIAPVFGTKPDDGRSE